VPAFRDTVPSVFLEDGPDGGQSTLDITHILDEPVFVVQVSGQILVILAIKELVVGFGITSQPDRGVLPL